MALQHLSVRPKNNKSPYCDRTLQLTNQTLCLLDRTLEKRRSSQADRYPEA
ncbi:hypothetical protein ACPOL_7263 (plasmid) [Acidisarcina polymorpha]|uniref:Uncharacterized protein n=1 Tax=Acidisarcina polymorpha TaxID=2211140 RepID=A0A2Z5GB54_9BACT|nr:hypothetical protein ACPOL_6926 [Acidisarcina polymorpha]AXC16453.1 hypothetical protein ACPOL_7263 [Acidisarcina polymorpha]